MRVQRRLARVPSVKLGVAIALGWMLGYSGGVSPAIAQRGDVLPPKLASLAEADFKPGRLGELIETRELPWNWVPDTTTSTS